MICPKCMKQGFAQTAIWYPDQHNSILKCRQCGERTELGKWLVPKYIPYAERYPMEREP